jgi:uncharacterized repeat protein (TIGR03803 family)
MRSKKFSRALTIVLVAFAISISVTATRAAAQTETILHYFGSSSTDGFWPEAGVIFDGSGNIYGTTSTGGEYGTMAGTAYELTPAEGGGWNEKILHNFDQNIDDGHGVVGGLIFDTAGNLYGTTEGGGTYGSGTVYELIHHGAGWTERILHNFGNGTDGKTPACTPILDASGNLYCTTLYGGTHKDGTVFELKHTASGWTEKVIYNFDVVHGAAPGLLMFDGNGNLWGTAGGGKSNKGVVFELVPKGGGAWEEKVAYYFPASGLDGETPGTLAFDSAGNLYGTTYKGGANGYGTLFELTPSGGGIWTESVVHSFSLEPGDCISPDGNLLMDASGNLWGVCEYGGEFGWGTVYEFSPATGGGWTENMVYNFGNGTTDGEVVAAGLVFDALGNIYGTTYAGSPNTCEGFANYCGTVYEITP